MDLHFYKGLKFKMTIVFSVVFILINIVFSRYTYLYFKKSFTKNYNKYLFSRAKTLLDRTEINPDLIALPDSGESIRVFTHRKQQQRIIFQSPGQIQRLVAPVRSGVVDSLGLHGVYLQKENDDGNPTELFLTVSNRELESKLRHLSLLMVLATLCSVLISALAVYAAAGWLLKPVKFIIRQATQINSERLNERINVSYTNDELQQLTENINAMLGRIEQEQQLQNSFFAAASHELRTPLAVLRAETELELVKSYPPAINSLLNSQLQEISRLQHIVEQFLLIGQLKHKGLKLFCSEVDLSEQILKVFNRNQLFLQQKALKTKIDFDENLPSFIVPGDREKLEVVWQNLLQNAIKYAGKNSMVNCTIKQEGNDTVVTFQNNTDEERIPTQDLGKAFTGASTSSGSTGLGLWLCKQLIDLHQGDLLFYSAKNSFSVSVKLKTIKIN